VASRESTALTGKRSYRMGLRAEAAAETGRSILRATLECYSERFFDQVSLEGIAERAGVTVQTILRRYSSKDELIAAAANEARQSLRSQRDEAPIGDVVGAIKVLVQSYEEHGDRVLRLLAQEDRVPAFRLITDTGRAYHYQWVERVFAPILAQRTGAERRDLLAQLIAACDLYFWKVLRRHLSLSRAKTERAMIEAVMAIGAARNDRSDTASGRRPLHQFRTKGT
jgi:AcrR family transcriptional regulator